SRLDPRRAHARRVHQRARAESRGRIVQEDREDSARRVIPVPSNPSPPSPGQRRRVAVLGATGAVGQAFIRLLVGHPWFELVSRAASERSAGKPYREAARWVGTGDMPPFVADMIVQPCDPDRVEADVVFSALDSAAAGDAEPAFARAGRTVLTN